MLGHSKPANPEGPKIILWSNILTSIDKSHMEYISSHWEIGLEMFGLIILHLFSSLLYCMTDTYHLDCI